MSDQKHRRPAILRWSGSKARLIPELCRYRPRQYGRYVEPFVGSACLFFQLSPHSAVLGDLNPHVIDVYRAIVEDPDAVADALESIPMTPDAFYTLRGLNPVHLDLVHRAARMIFLMKGCFNGVYRTNRSGAFNVPMGNKVYALPTRNDLQRAAEMLRSATLINGDFRETISQSVKGDWVYMDPPYRQAGRYRGEYGYSAAFDMGLFEQFVSEAVSLASRGVQVMISYQLEHSLIEALPDWSVHFVSPLRSVAGKTGSRVRASEVIMTSYPS